MKMKRTYKISGEHAIRLAERDGLRLRKYADPIQGYLDNITPDQAREAAKADPSLVYVIVIPTGWAGPADGVNVLDYFRGSLNGHALSGATYLGPDCDGVEPTWMDADGGH